MCCQILWNWLFYRINISLLVKISIVFSILLKSLWDRKFDKVLGFMRLLILQGMVSVLSACLQTHNMGPSDVKGSRAKAGTHFIIVRVSLYMLNGTL